MLEDGKKNVFVSMEKHTISEVLIRKVSHQLASQASRPESIE